MLINYTHTGFNCPVCAFKHAEDEYYERLIRSNGILNMPCKGCKTPLQVSDSITGKIFVKEMPKKAKFFKTL